MDSVDEIYEDEEELEDQEEYSDEDEEDENGDGDVSMEDDSIDKDELDFVKKSGNIIEGKRRNKAN